ncbi:MAG: hypothetical protein U1E12_16365 [Hydrogenophaga sp.]|jgi:hypothetical protein|uniref:hypothetical protein n=1 Tax=unclassified Hydrogenophaga TaxID=2610897 RepID=UPI001BB0F117|nr:MULTISPECIES: hypothetical protein [unclassified Hydrogenophaga]MDP3811709.1 hypothetical protein [Hydrogenophaga sp.]MDZ4103243.1 hypothetical protein [Hydrogenophaga sp.]MDZ4279630.1 hypothetical protein [Hydrogenophaga sp.]
MIKRVFVLALAAAAMMPAAHARDVGVTVEFSQPGVFGRIDIGRVARPTVIIRQPLIIESRAVFVQPQPIYMWVPSGHRKNWRKYCREYDACGVPVYFVRHDWYDKHVRYRDDDDDDDDDRRRSKGKREYRDADCRVEIEVERGRYSKEVECER